jgi:hypothetical protein
MLLWAAVGFVFVLGCINIGGMLLARASGRIGEIATRLALGAPFSRIVRQLLIESTALGLLGGLAGAMVGWGALAGLREFGALTFPFLETVTIDVRVLAATLLLTLIAGIAFGLAPAWQATRVDLRSAQSGSRGVAGRKRFISLGALVGGQVALTVPLLFGAGLFLHTFLYLWNMSPGFDPDHVMFARFSLEDARYKTSAQMNQLYDKALLRLHETPGIEAAGVSLTLPYERALNEGVRIGASDRVEATNLTYVTPELFTALRQAVPQEWRAVGTINQDRRPAALHRRNCGRRSGQTRWLGQLWAGGAYSHGLRAGSAVRRNGRAYLVFAQMGGAQLARRRAGGEGD